MNISATRSNRLPNSFKEIIGSSFWLTRKHAARVGLHDSASETLADRFTPHCCRHWLVTHLLRAGMSRDHVKWILGDAMKEL
jgi:site-specific recombinase XerD